MPDEITHAEIYSRLIEVENKVDEINKRTKDVVDAFSAAKGAFTVLEFIAKIAKPLLWIGALCTSVGLIWSNYKL